MAALLLYPGDVGEPVSLQAILKEAHNASRQGVLEEMTARAKAGVPLDDSTDWRLVGSAAERVAGAPTQAAAEVLAPRLADATGSGRRLEARAAAAHRADARAAGAGDVRHEPRRDPAALADEA